MSQCTSNKEEFGGNWYNAASYRTSCQDPDSEDGITFPPINMLPILASDYMKESSNNIPCGWTPKVKTLFAGVLDKKSCLHSLMGFEDSILRTIISFFASEYTSHVKLTLPAKNTGKIFGEILCRFQSRSEYYGEYNEAEDLKSDYVSFASCGVILFPEPQDRNVNMMPFILGEKDSLPDHLQCYYDCIQHCPINKSEIGSVCYLTVHESFVSAQSSQRRDGLHIEAPGKISSSSSAVFTPGHEHHWGGGHFMSRDEYEGGIYFASNISNTSIVYNALIDKNVPGIVDEHGSCEHLRPFIGPGTRLEAGQLVWMTDRTPHEAVPQDEDGYRQFFRVVTSKVSHWFAEHSTVNPKVALPDDVIVVQGNKFESLENRKISD